MTCRKGCGSGLGNIELIVKDLIRQMIDDGKLQEGLVDCKDQKIWRGGRVVTCDILAAAVCQLVDDGVLCLKEIDALTYDAATHTLSILFNDSTKKSTTLPISDTKVQSVELDDTTLVIKSTDGGSVRADLLALVRRVQQAIADKFGHTIELGAIDPDKWDVKFDQAHFEAIPGIGLHLKDSVLQPLKNADIMSGVLAGSNLELVKVDGSRVTIPLGALVPAAKADHFLKAVTYDQIEKKLKFTVGNDLDPTENSYEVEIADLIPVVSARGLQGNGTVRSPLVVKTQPNSGLRVDGTGVAVLVDGTTVRVNAQGQLEAAGGMDCAAIAALPKRPWKKGTTLLAKQGDDCVQLAALDSIFQEIGVGITADKTSAFVGEVYDVTVTVTNTGESKNDLTNLTVQKPLLGNYEILNVTTSKNGVDTVDRLDDLNYNLRGLAKGGTFILRFQVKCKDVGTYQFTASVNPNSALDQNAKNNTDTVILKTNSRIDDSFVPSVDCPRITLTDMATNAELQPAIPAARGSDLVFLYPYTAAGRLNNAYTNKTTLNGTQIRFSTPVTIAVYATNLSTGDLWNVGGTQFRTSGAGVSPSADPRNALPADNNSVENALTSADNQTFTFSKDVNNVMLLARPRGKNCRWQGWYLHCAVPTPTTGVTLTGVTGGTVNQVPSTSGGAKVAISEVLTIPAKALTMAYAGSVATKPQLVVNRGTPATATINNPSGRVFAQTVGLVTITPTNITVHPAATSSDSIIGEYFDVIIKD